jgi:hypothetical protein
VITPLALHRVLNIMCEKIINTQLSVVGCWIFGFKLFGSRHFDIGPNIGQYLSYLVKNYQTSLLNIHRNSNKTDFFSL